MVTNSGDPGGHLGFVREEEEEEEMAVGEDCSDSDSDDDIGRYVFLARQPALVDSQAQAEDDASSGDDDDAMPGGEAGDSSGGKRLLLREIFDASPSRKKARVDLTPLLAPAGPSVSETAPSQCGARAKESGSHVRVPEQEGEAKNKKCGKRKWSPGREAGEGSYRVVAAAKTAAVDPGASRRFVCNICGRCFVSHQALGGHVLGHMKKAKNEEVAGGNGYCNEKMAAVAVSQEVANGNDNNNENTVIAASHDHTGGNGHDEEKAITLPSYGYYDNGNSNSDEEMAIVVANQNGHNADRNAKEKKVLAAASHNDADGNRDAKEKKVAVGRCHKGASNGNSSVRKTQHKCEVCGKECLSGQALGGHMRKHRERPAHDGGGGEGRSARPASAGDSEPPCLQRAAVITGEQPAQ